MKLTLVNGTMLDSRVYKLGKGYGLLLEEGSDMRLLLDVGKSKNFFYNARFLDVDFRKINFVVAMNAFTNHNGFLKRAVRKSFKAKFIASIKSFSCFRNEKKHKLTSLTKQFKQKQFTILVDSDFKVSENIHFFSFPLALDRYEYTRNNEKDLLEHELFCLLKTKAGIVLIIMETKKPLTLIIKYTEEKLNKKINYVIGAITDLSEELRDDIIYYDFSLNELTRIKRPFKIGNTLDFNKLDDFLERDKYEF